MSFTEERAERIESKLDKVTETLQKLVLIEERQMTQGQRMGALEDRVAKIEVESRETRRALDKWVNTILGAAGLIGVLLTIWQSFQGIRGG